MLLTEKNTEEILNFFKVENPLKIDKPDSLIHGFTTVEGGIKILVIQLDTFITGSTIDFISKKIRSLDLSYNIFSGKEPLLELHIF